MSEAHAPIANLVEGDNITFTPVDGRGTYRVDAAGSADAVLSVSGGVGIDVDNTLPQQPIVNNTGVLTVTAGTNVTVTGTAQNPVINATGGGGGVSSVIAGTGITVDTPTGDVTVTNDGVLTAVSGNAGIEVDTDGPGDNGNITILNTGVLGITGTGAGINVNNTDAQNPVVSNTGVTSLVADTGLSVSASTGAVTVGVSNVGVVPHLRTWDSTSWTVPDSVLTFDPNAQFTAPADGVYMVTVTVRLSLASNTINADGQFLQNVSGSASEEWQTLTIYGDTSSVDLAAETWTVTGVTGQPIYILVFNGVFACSTGDVIGYKAERTGTPDAIRTDAAVQYKRADQSDL